MVEEHTVWIVLKHRIGQCGVKIGAMNLMISRAESLDVIVSAGPYLYDFAGLEMAYEVRLGWPGFLRYPLANTKEVECVHRIRRDSHTGADLSEFSCLLEHGDAVAEML
jgi:hypothetical protein